MYSCGADEQAPPHAATHAAGHETSHLVRPRKPKPNNDLLGLQTGSLHVYTQTGSTQYAANPRGTHTPRNITPRSRPPVVIESQTHACLSKCSCCALLRTHACCSFKHACCRHVATLWAIATTHTRTVEINLQVAAHLPICELHTVAAQKRFFGDLHVESPHA